MIAATTIDAVPLVRDFGDDPEHLRAKVKQTVLHEVGHHFGFDETGVRKLGL